MGKTLVLAEKPSVGRELARVLGCNQSRDGYISGSKYIVTWALGHLVELADPEHYGKQYATWSLETLPMLPKTMELVVIKGTGKQFNVVKTLLKSPEVSELVIATDAGREGELVARWILKKAGFHKPIKRLWISSQTDKSIREGFAKLRPAREYDNLYESARCRAEADWLVGLNVTRALTCKFNAQLTAGRVQTPTLAMIVAREEEIRRFVPKEFYTISAELPGFSAQFRDEKTGQSRIFNKEKAEQLLVALKGIQAAVSDLRQESKREAPPLLYDLTELQREANSRYGFSAKQTLNIIQRLYEVHKVLTYPRTDSRYLTRDMVSTLKDRVRAVSSDRDLEPLCKMVMTKGLEAGKRIVDDSKVTDHHAIIPTEEFPRFYDFDSEERRIYDMVAKRFLAVFCGDFRYDQVTVKVDIGGQAFYAKGKIVRDKGWKNAYGNMEITEDENRQGEEEDVNVKSQTLPELKRGQALAVKSLRLDTGKTPPPARYTEGTLLSAMEHPGKFIDDSSLRNVVDSTGGIGTPATRADIIEKLFAVNYIERQGKHLAPLSKGKQLIELVPEELRSPELTAKWEKRLTSISRGQEKSEAFIGEMRGFASHLVGRVKSSEGSYRHDNLTRTKCPDCGKYLLEVNGKKGKMLVCQDRECGYRQNLAYLSNARCPTCHKKLTVKGEGDKRLYTCTCGFREKFDRFNKQLAENKDQAGKRELEAYMRKQEQEQQVESPFAIAFAKLAANPDGDDALAALKTTAVENEKHTKTAGKNTGSDNEKRRDSSRNRGKDENHNTSDHSGKNANDRATGSNGKNRSNRSSGNKGNDGNRGASGKRGGNDKRGQQFSSERDKTKTAPGQDEKSAGNSKQEKRNKTASRTGNRNQNANQGVDRNNSRNGGTSNGSNRGSNKENSRNNSR